LLEVGTGFHPELSGRENVYLNGAIIGMKKAEVDRKFDEIVAFAEVEKFIDTPVKRYSSGMTVRLGFSVASSLEPDILIIDEVLGVGDLGFQRKCFERMEELINKRGTTVLLVSHNIRQVARICSRALLVDGGVIAREGDAAQICNEYFNLTYKEGVNASSKLSKAEKPARGSGEVELEEINLFRAKETTPTDELELHEPMRIGVKFRAQVDLIQPEIIIGFQTTDYLHVASTSSAAMKARPDFSKGDHYFECELQDLPLSPGIYKLRIGFLDRNRRLMVEHTNAKVFSILGGKRDITKTSAFGLVDLPFQWVFSTATEAFCNSYLSQPANSPPEKESIPLPRFTGGARK
jgi:ABC-type polysaccharide/polyol phosphate transport system, ATPase component